MAIATTSPALRPLAGDRNEDLRSAHGAEARRARPGASAAGGATARWLAALIVVVLGVATALAPVAPHANVAAALPASGPLPAPAP